jgi:hypothetical protein
VICRERLESQWLEGRELVDGREHRLLFERLDRYKGIGGGGDGGDGGF